MDHVRSWVASRWFFYAILVIFVLETSWVILTLAYPGIFDEGWHYQIIKEHATQWWPILTTQSPDTYHLGNLTYDPSFLYHYLLSMPYNVLNATGFGDNAIIIILRFMNAAMMLASLIVFRRVFLHTGASHAVAHLTLLFFVLIPVVPFLGAQINNDNLVIVWVALSALLLLKWRESFKTGNPSLPLFLLTASAALFGGMSQYVFLPVLAFVGIILAYDLLRVLYYRRFRALLDINQLKRPLGVLSITAMLVATSLFISSYGVNLVRYHSPIPSCDRILSIAQCRQYYTFERNYTAEMTNPPVDASAIKFSAGWMYRLYTTSFYTALNGSKMPLQIPPFPLPAFIAATMLLTSAVAFVASWRHDMRHRKDILLIFSLALFFVAVLWFHNYHDFLQYRAKLGINGRYLLLVTPLIMITGAMALKYAFRNMRTLGVATLVVALLCFMHGGGVTNYIVASDHTWWWHWDETKAIAGFAKSALSPIIIRFQLFW